MYNSFILQHNQLSGIITIVALHIITLVDIAFVCLVEMSKDLFKLWWSKILPVHIYNLSNSLIFKPSYRKEIYFLGPQIAPEQLLASRDPLISIHEN